MTKNSPATIWGYAFASLVLLPVGALMLLGSFGQAAHAVGTDTGRQGDTCTISYTTAVGQDFTLVDDGGKHGCRMEVG